jgi:hypothetical protein
MIRETRLRIDRQSPVGSKLAEAKEHGVDLTLLVENLDLSVDERLWKLYSIASFLETLRPHTSASR